MIMPPRLLNKWFKSAWVIIDVKILCGWSLINFGIKKKYSLLITPIKSVKIKTEIKKNPVIRYCQSYFDIELLKGKF